MPTALDATAERIAPTRATTDYFNPAAGQSVMSRYANEGRRLADSELVAEAGSRLLQSRENRLAQRRNTVKFDRDEEEYQEKQDFKIQRGRFLGDIAALDPEAADFDDQISQLYTTLPPGAMQDDAVGDLIASKRATANDLRNQRQTAERDELEFGRRMQLANQRLMNHPTLSVLSAEERNKYVLPDGSFDSIGATSAAFEKGRKVKAEDFANKEEIKQSFRIEDAKDDELDKSQKELKALAREHATGDAVAFPGHVESIRSRTKGDKKFTEDDVKAAPDYAAARKYDGDKFVSELASARNMSKDEYVNKVTGLDQTAKDKRATVWDAAQVGIPEKTAPAPAAVAKPLDRETAEAIRKEAGGDKDKARQIARERGYSF